MTKVPRIRRRRTGSSRRIRKLVHKLESIHDRPNGAGAPEVFQGMRLDSPSDDLGVQLHDLYDVAPIGFYSLDRQARISELNQKGAKLLGFSSNWLLGK